MVLTKRMVVQMRFREHFNHSSRKSLFIGQTLMKRYLQLFTKMFFLALGQSKAVAVRLKGCDDTKDAHTPVVF